MGRQAAYIKYQGCCVQSLCNQHTLVASPGQERKLQVFHLRRLRRVLRVYWQDKVTNNEVLDRAGVPSMYTLLRQRRL